MLKIGTLCWILSGPQDTRWSRRIIGRVGEIVGPLEFVTANGGLSYSVRVDDDEWWISPNELSAFSDPDNARPEHITRPVERVA